MKMDIIISMLLGGGLTFMGVIIGWAMCTVTIRQTRQENDR
jgi:ABC-type branched-subunit amino acid transport system permease subunit